MSRRFPPELDLLLGLLRSVLHGTPAPIPPASLDWAAFLAQVERHRVAALLHSHAAASAVYPAGIAARLQASAQALARRSLAVLAEQLRLTGVLADAGIESLVVKGLVLSAQLHGGIGRRHVGDLDLLVRPGDALRADAALQAAGLRRSRPDFPLTPRQARAYLQLKPEFEYRLSAPPHRVELLWRLEGLPDSIDLFAAAVVCPISGHPVRTVAPALNVPYLFEHGARHAWFRLFWLVDVARLLLDPAQDWGATMRFARTQRMERALWSGAALACDLLACPLPPALVPGDRGRSAVAPLVREARRQIARAPAADERPVEWFRQAAYRVRLRRGLRGKASAVAPHLLSPLNWRTLPLPDRLFFLYPVLSPFLWVARRCRRA